MMIELAEGVPAGCGVTGVTRLIDTGAPTGVTPLVVTSPVLGVLTERITVPVKVPFGSPVGSAYTVRSIPSGGSSPLDGSTRLSHGLSRLAVKGKVPSGKPGTCTMMGTRIVLPTGAPLLGLFETIDSGVSTARMVMELFVN